MRKNLLSALHASSSLLVVALLYSACSTRPTGRDVTSGSTAGTNGSIPGAGAQSSGGGAANTGGVGSSTGGMQSSGGLGSGTGGTMVIMQDDPSCTTSEL